MAATEQVTEWDAQGSPITSGQSAATEWDAQGNPIHASAAPSLSDNPNGEGLYQMKAPTGQAIGVPYSKVVDARNQGHSFADANEQGRFNKDSAYANRPQNHVLSPQGGAINTAIDSAANFGSHIWNDAKGAVQAVAAPPSTPDEAAAASTPAGQAGLAAYRMIAKPSVDAVATAAQEAKKGNLFKKDEYDQDGNYQPSAFSSAVDAIPVVGPWTRQIETEAHQKGAIPALAGAAGDVAFGEATGKVGGKVVGKAMDWAGQHMPVDGENFTPVQHRAMSGVLARGTGMGKDFFPRDVAQTILSPLRQEAADNPALVKVIQEGKPDDAMGAFQSLLGSAKEKIDVAHQNALQPVKDTSFDMAPVQKAVTFPKSLEGFAPEDAKAIGDLRERLGNVKTLEGANELRMWLNRELSPQFRKNSVAAGRSGAVDSALEDARSALRDPYYDSLQKASGQDFSDLKRTEGGIIKAQEAIGNVAPDLAKKEALATEPKSAKQLIADGLKGGRTIHGGPITGTANLIAEKVLKSTPLGDVQEGLKRVFSKLPDKSAPPAPAPPPNQPLQLPAPQGGTPFSIENSGHGAEPFPGSMAGVPSPEPVPATVTPARAPNLQLPAQAGPEGTGVPATPTWDAPPAVNDATSRTRVQPLPENPEPVPPTPAGFTVGPDGTAQRVPAGALPAPAKATRAPRAAKPAMSHPAGDVTGIDEATGLPIVRRGTPAATSPSGEPERPPIQASANPEDLRASAADQKPVMQDMAEKAVEGVPGAEVEGMRVKDADSIENKADRGKPPETISDHLGARVSAPTPEGVEQVKQNVEAQLPVTDADKITNNGVDADQYAVQTGKPGEANQQSELQVVTKPQAEAMTATDGLYEQQKEAEAKGDTQKAASLGERIAQHFEKAKADTGTTNEGAKQEVAQQGKGLQTFAKGDRVTLPDGRPGTVAFYDGKITKNARVLADDGKMVTSVKGADLKPGSLPIGKPINGEITQLVKERVARGEPVKIFSRRISDDASGANRSAIDQWTKEQFGKVLPVTDVKEVSDGAIYDDSSNVEHNTGRILSHTTNPADANKPILVDLDGTLAKAEETNVQPRNGGGADAVAKTEDGGDVPAQKEAANQAGPAAGSSNASANASQGKEALGGNGGKQGAEKSWAETVKAKKAAAKQQMTEAHGLMAGEHALGGQELDSAAENLRVYFEGQEREHGANALKAIQKSVEETVDETDAGAGHNPVQRMEKGRHEGSQGSNASERDE